jgi:16S rRNA (guanine527-N7)-methyltransferase
VNTRSGRDEAAVIRAAASAIGFAMDAAALERVLRFSATLALWNRRLRLTGERDPVRVAERHIGDSLALVALLPETGPVVDIGSGQGFPGIILGCIRPDLGLVLIEARRRRANFLRDAIRRIPLEHVEVLAQRAESVGAPVAGRARVVVARALRLEAFLALARPLLAPGAQAIAMQSERGLLSASTIAARSGFRIFREHRYTLLDGSPRVLVAFVAEV